MVRSAVASGAAVTRQPRRLSLKGTDAILWGV